MKFNVTSKTHRDLRSSGRESALTVSRITRSFTNFARPSRKFRIPQGAFTLVEIMLALAIFTMLTAALYATWILIMKATVIGKGRAAQLQRERIAMQTLEDSLTCIQSHQASIDYYLFEVQNGEQPALSFVAYLPDDFPRSGEFLSVTPDGQKMDYHLRRLTYSLQADESGHGKDLVVRQNPILMNLTPEEQNTPLVLAKNVSDFLIECWDTNNMQWDTEWDATNMLPPLMRVTLAFGDAYSVQAAQVITREVSFPSATMPTIVQTPNFNGSYQPSFNLPGAGGGQGNTGNGFIGPPGFPSGPGSGGRP